MPDTEVRETADTGGQKGQKPVQMSLVPPFALSEVARVYAMGAEKYDRNNWRKGYPWHLSYDAAQRHMMAYWNGETTDPESGLHHCAHAIFHMLSLIEFGEIYPEGDDRPNTTKTKQQLAKEFAEVFAEAKQLSYSEWTGAGPLEALGADE